MSSIAQPHTPAGPFGARISDWALWPLFGYSLFFMMLFVPTAYKLPKVALIAVVLTTVTAKFLKTRGRTFLHRSVVAWTWFFAAVGLFFAILGVVHGGPGSVQNLSVFVAWPLLYLVLLAAISERKILRGLLRVMVVATIAVEAYALSYIFNSVGLLPDAFYIDLDLGQHIEFYGRFIEFSLFSLSSLIFLVPFIMTALLIWPRSSEVVRRIWLWIALVLGLAVISMSARRALMLVLLLAPVAAVAGRALLPDQRGQISWKMVIWGLVVTVLLGSGVFLYLNFAYEIEWEALHWLFVSSFSPEFDVSATIRLEQFEGLIQEWRRRPIFGKGIGTTLEALRMSEQPWSYELQYVAMLAQTGLVGVTCFGAGLTWIGWQCIRIIRTGDELARWLLPVCVGTLCFLAATGTNQYIGKYDYLWVIFLPLAFVNMHLLSKGAVLQPEG